MSSTIIMLLCLSVIAALLCSQTDSFSISSGFKYRATDVFRSNRVAPVISTLSLNTMSTSAAVCAAPAEIESPDISATILKSVKVTIANGERIKLGDKIAMDRPTIVIFLRHLACPYCWSYAKEWSNFQAEIAEANISGPLFVSIGDKDKLNKFLDINPYMDRNNVFVDDYTEFSAYNALGFGRFDQTDKEVAKQVKLSSPSIGGLKAWWNYFANLNSLSPVPKGLQFGQIPEGVLRLGGTFVLSGDEVIYRWDDRLPGDHPDIKRVLEIARGKSKKL
jgi:hypothetical protein